LDRNEIYTKFPLLQKQTHMKKAHVLITTFMVSCFLLPVLTGCKQESVEPGGNETGQELQNIPQLVREGNVTKLYADGQPFLMISGELHNSTCGGFEYMRPVWKRMAEKNLNSVIASVSWELMEPEEGKFDFSLVDSILAGAREADLKLALIWFASWKNGGSSYMPSWVKRDSDRFPRVKDENGKALEILSTFSDANCEADAKAFAALMKHIREVDAEQQTVIAVQIENEVGIIDHLGETPGNARRDFSEAANLAYNGSVPGMLLDYLQQYDGKLHPELQKVWKANGSKTEGTWEEVFGKSVFRPEITDFNFFSFYTEELFTAWYYARFLEEVAAAGKKEYPLPMFVNAQLKQTYGYWPGRYFTGGPQPQLLDVWKAGAPSVDILAPDIYSNDFLTTCEEYTRNGNPLFIPESRGGAVGVARAFSAFGEYDAICFAPFGIDGGSNENDPLPDAYRVLRNMEEIILENQGKGTMRGIYIDTASPVKELDMGEYNLVARLAGGANPGVAGAIIIKTGQDEYIVGGTSMNILIVPKNKADRWGLDIVDEGHFEDGKWISTRRLNGDQTLHSTWAGSGFKLPVNKSAMLKVSFYPYE
jgi:hypothetical protein